MTKDKAPPEPGSPEAIRAIRLAEAVRLIGLGHTIREAAQETLQAPRDVRNALARFRRKRRREHAAKVAAILARPLTGPGSRHREARQRRDEAQKPRKTRARRRVRG